MLKQIIILTLVYRWKNSEARVNYEVDRIRSPICVLHGFDKFHGISERYDTHRTCLDLLVSF